MNSHIFLSYPHLGGTEMKWIEAAFKESWVVPLGPNVDEFEKRLRNYLSANSVVALSAGTAALHLGLVMLGVEKDDEVICQSFTFSASANPILYQGARPVFVDSEEETWNMSPKYLEEAIIDRKEKTGKYPKAIIPVHLYGMPAKMNEILSIANKYDIPVLEDAAEALGSEYCGKKCGTLGNYGALSFNGNKIITTSGGGALICPTQESAKKTLHYATQSREPLPYYYHKDLGYNYRLSNISAGIGCGQMDVLAAHVQRRRDIHKIYSNEIEKIPHIKVKENPNKDFNSNFWLTTMYFDNQLEKTPEELRVAFAKEDIETRWLWRPMHMQPIYKDCPYYGTNIAENIYNHGLCLPSGSNLTDEDINRVVNVLSDIFK